MQPTISIALGQDLSKGVVGKVTIVYLRGILCLINVLAITVIGAIFAVAVDAQLVGE